MCIHIFVFRPLVSPVPEGETVDIYWRFVDGPASRLSPGNAGLERHVHPDGRRGQLEGKAVFSHDEISRRPGVQYNDS